MKVIFCTPSLSGPTAPYIAALEASIPLVQAAGWEEGYAQVVGSPYISNARSTMVRNALDHSPDCLVFLDYDVSWDPQDLVTLLQTEGDVVCGTYRFKLDTEQYMGTLMDNADNLPVVRRDGCIRAQWMPAGFLKVTTKAIHKFMREYPQLLYGPPWRYSIDLFNHGAHEGIWYGEDFAFCRNWRAIGGEVWCIPNLNITHHSKDKAYPGNFHMFLRRQPGGDLCPAST